jgi:hypothetical protein
MKRFVDIDAIFIFIPTEHFIQRNKYFYSKLRASDYIFQIKIRVLFVMSISIWFYTAIPLGPGEFW